MTSTSQDPAVSVSDAVSTFTRAIKQTFAEVQKQARAEAVQSAQTIKDERDEVLKTVSIYEADLQACKLELGNTKASLQQAELTISHQAQTILQLRREITQWRDQSRNWQDHFLRVEEERCGLSSRLDELITSQRSMFAMSLATLPKYPPTQQPSTSSASASTATPPQDAPNAINSLPTPRSTTKQQNKTPKLKRRELTSPGSTSTSEDASNASTSRPLTTASVRPTTQNPTKRPLHVAHAPDVVIPSNPNLSASAAHTVIRRVQAVINVPIKEEDLDSEHELTSNPSTPPSTSTSKAKPKATTTKPKPSRSQSRSKRRIIQDDVDDYSERESGNAGDDVNEGDAEEGVGRSLVVGEDEDDELMLGATPNKRPTAQPQQTRSTTNSNSTTSTSRKRKQSDTARAPIATKVRKIPAT